MERLIIEIEQDDSFDSFKKLMQQNHIQIFICRYIPRKFGVCIPSSNKNRLMKPISFFTILKSEHYKLRFNIAIWLFLLFLLFMTLCH